MPMFRQTDETVGWSKTCLPLSRRNKLLDKYYYLGRGGNHD